MDHYLGLFNTPSIYALTVKSPDDNPSVGLILCRDENRTIAEYALRDMSKPIGVSEYHLCTDLPLDLKSALPDPEEIRSRIDMKK